MNFNTTQIYYSIYFPVKEKIFSLSITVCLFSSGKDFPIVSSLESKYWTQFWKYIVRLMRFESLVELVDGGWRERLSKFEINGNHSSLKFFCSNWIFRNKALDQFRANGGQEVLRTISIWEISSFFQKKIFGRGCRDI